MTSRFVTGITAGLGMAAAVAGCAGGQSSQSTSTAAESVVVGEVERVVLTAPESLYLAEPEGPATPVTEGTRLRFAGNPTTALREMVGAMLPDAIAVSGGAAADVRIATTDLNGDGRDEAIVMIHSGPYCGSGNVCNFWMFEQNSGGWRQINGNDDAADDLYVMPGATNGYRNIGIRGQCATEICDFLLAYNGNAYQWVNDPTPTPVQ